MTSAHGHETGWLQDRTADWVAQGLITGDQAQAILDAEARPAAPARPQRSSLVVEALGYVGGALILAAVLLIAARLWDDLGLPGRLALVGVTAALLAAAGTAVPGRLGPAAARLRSVLWTLSVVAAGGTLALVGEALDWTGSGTALLVGAGSAVVAGSMWWVERSSLLQVALFAATLLTAAAVVVQVGADEDETWPALVLWALSVAWFALGWADRVTPRRTAFVLGSVGAVLSLQVALSTGETWGLVLALVTVAGLVAVAMALGDLVVLAVAAIGTLLVLPRVAQEWFPGALSAPIALLVVGVLLVLAAIRTARRRATSPSAT